MNLVKKGLALVIALSMVLVLFGGITVFATPATISLTVVNDGALLLGHDVTVDVELSIDGVSNFADLQVIVEMPDGLELNEVNSQWGSGGGAVILPPTGNVVFMPGEVSALQSPFATLTLELATGATAGLSSITLDVEGFDDVNFAQVVFTADIEDITVYAGLTEVAVAEIAGVTVPHGTLITETGALLNDLIPTIVVTYSTPGTPAAFLFTRTYAVTWGNVAGGDFDSEIAGTSGVATATALTPIAGEDNVPVGVDVTAIDLSTVTVDVTVDNSGPGIYAVRFVGGNNAFPNALGNGFRRIVILIEDAVGVATTYWAPSVAGTDYYFFWAPEIGGFDGVVRTTETDAADIEITWNEGAVSNTNVIGRYGDMTGNGQIAGADSVQILAMRRRMIASTPENPSNEDVRLLLTAAVQANASDVVGASSVQILALRRAELAGDTFILLHVAANAVRISN